jgi:hypothetical protein
MRIAGVLGSPTRTRTWDLRFRKPVLYPTELLSRFIVFLYCMQNFLGIEVDFVQTLISTTTENYKILSSILLSIMFDLYFYLIFHC